MVVSQLKKKAVVPILDRDDTTEAATRLTRRGCAALSAEASAKAGKSAGTKSFGQAIPG
jgi:hypothetical protein